MTALLLATRDGALERRVAPALARWGFDVDVVRTNLELVWRLTRATPAHDLPAVVLDVRAGSFGAEALRWLRDDPVPCTLVCLADERDEDARAAAELAEAAAVLTLPAGRLPAGRVVRDVRTVLRGRRERDRLRWTPPRGVPRLHVARRPAAACL